MKGKRRVAKVSGSACDGDVCDSEAFAEVSNKTRHLNFLADCRAAATMKTSRDNRLMMKCMYLLIYFFSFLKSNFNRFEWFHEKEKTCLSTA